MGILFIFLKKKDFKENSHVKVHFFLLVLVVCFGILLILSDKLFFNNSHLNQMSKFIKHFVISYLTNVTRTASNTNKTILKLTYPRTFYTKVYAWAIIFPLFNYSSTKVWGQLWPSTH